MDEFECACCHRTFATGRSWEDALAEKDILYPDVPNEKCSVVCDDCFKQLRPYDA